MMPVLGAVPLKRFSGSQFVAYTLIETFRDRAGAACAALRELLYKSLEFMTAVCLRSENGLA